MSDSEAEKGNQSECPKMKFQYEQYIVGGPQPCMFGFKDGKHQWRVWGREIICSRCGYSAFTRGPVLRALEEDGLAADVLRRDIEELRAQIKGLRGLTESA